MAVRRGLVVCYWLFWRKSYLKRHTSIVLEDCWIHTFPTCKMDGTHVHMFTSAFYLGMTQFNAAINFAKFWSSGLRQWESKFSVSWYARFFMVPCWFRACFLQMHDNFIILAVVVDDIKFASNSWDMLTHLKEQLSARFDIKLFGKLTSFIGW